MNNYFNLELDTTGPEIDIYAPSYTLNGIKTEVVVNYNDKILESECEIYIIDSNKNRHDFIFMNDDINNQLIGEIYLDLPAGPATIYATVRDEVLNFSNLASKNLIIYTTRKLNIKTNSYLNNKIKGKLSIGKVNNIKKYKIIKLNTNYRNINNNKSYRKIITSIKEVNNDG